MRYFQSFFFIGNSWRYDPPPGGRQSNISDP
jgi:hypothetical protein